MKKFQGNLIIFLFLDDNFYHRISKKKNRKVRRSDFNDNHSGSDDDEQHSRVIKNHVVFFCENYSIFLNFTRRFRLNHLLYHQICQLKAKKN